MDKLQPVSAENDDVPSVDLGKPQAGILHTLVSVARSIRAILSLRLAELGLGSGQDELLICLEGGAPVSTTTLAARLNLRAVSLTQLLDPLLARGLVERLGDQDGQRSMIVKVSATGEAMQKRIRAIWSEVGQELVGTDGTAQLDRLIGELEGLHTQINVRLTRFS